MNESLSWIVAVALVHRLGHGARCDAAVGANPALAHAPGKSRNNNGMGAGRCFRGGEVDAMGLSHLDASC